MAQCAGMTMRGTRCRVRVTNEGDLCLFHDPEQGAALAAAQHSGGAPAKERGLKPAEDLPGGPPKTAAEAMTWSAWLVRAVAEGSVGTTTASQVASSLRVFLQSLDKAELEGQVAELRAKLQELQRREAAR